MEVHFRNMEGSKRMYKFNENLGEDFKVWETRKEAVLEANEILHAVKADLIA